MKNKIKKTKVTYIFDGVQLLASAVLTIGSQTFFAACPVGEKAMACHWAERAILGVGLALTFISLLQFVISNPKISKGLNLAVLPLAILTGLIPGVLIRLCGMLDMRCHTVFKPAVLIFSVAIFFVATINVLQNRQAESVALINGKEELV